MTYSSEYGTLSVEAFLTLERLCFSEEEPFASGKLLFSMSGPILYATFPSSMPFGDVKENNFYDKKCHFISQKDHLFLLFFIDIILKLWYVIGIIKTEENLP